MLSSWLFTTAIAVSSIFGSALAAPNPGPADDAVFRKDTIDLLKDGLPKYNKAADKDGMLKITYDAVENLVKAEKKKIKAGKRSSGGCNLRKVKVRREWNTLSNPEKKRYTDAIKCLHSKPARYDPLLVPGAKSRYDDFVAVHIIQTRRIHATANFLHWHRYYLHLFEKALAEECNYTGQFPYWNWAATANQPVPSYVFNDGPFGLSGDGDYIPHNLNGTPMGRGAVWIPFEPNGGGCVTTGPFANWTVNLGPIDPTLDLVPSIATDDPTSHLIHNPRCLRRAISKFVANNWSTSEHILDLLLNPSYSSIGPFQFRLQGDFPNGYVGLHAGGHFTIGGDPGGDLFAAPGEPAFWVHHTQVDRIWWLWQLLDPSGERFNQVAGTITMVNIPPSRNGTLEDVIDMEAVSPVTKKMKELVSSVDGPFCYIYL